VYIGNIVREEDGRDAIPHVEIGAERTGGLVHAYKSVIIYNFFGR
jgi:hypothetical protein